MSVSRNPSEYRQAPDARPDRLHLEHRPGSGHAEGTGPVDPLRPVRDRLLFLKARSVLASLCGCTESQAAQALLATAARHGVTTWDVGERFLATTLDADPRRGAGGGDAEHIVGNLVEAAVAASANDQPRRRSRPEGRRDLPRRVPDRGAGTGPARPGDPLRFRAWGLVVEGDLDLTTQPSLRDAVERLDWHDPSPGHASEALLLDLSAVTFVDARGTHALDDVHAYVTARGVRLHVTPPTDPGARRLLQLAVRAGWLPPPFAPGEQVQPATGDPRRPAWQASRRASG